MISESTRGKWDREIAYLLENGGRYLSQWEKDRVDEWSIRREYGKDLTMQQAIKLSEIYRKVQGKVG